MKIISVKETELKGKPVRNIVVNMELSGDEIETLFCAIGTTCQEERNEVAQNYFYRNLTMSASEVQELYCHFRLLATGEDLRNKIVVGAAMD